MRVKWTAIPNVVSTNPVASAAAPALAERSKKEATQEREANKKDKKKPERALDWLRRSR
jgi:hypothetical protein